MNTRTMCMLLAAAASASAAFAQGTLTPPGSPAPTYRTLTQVEPRTAITNLPYTISQPGSYYLATNLTVVGTGVTIATNAVTLDLMGFTLTGRRFAGEYGVSLVGPSERPLQDVTVRNGAVRGFGHGIHAKNSRGARFEDLCVSSNLNYGINLDGLGGRAQGNAIVRCSLTTNGWAAIRLYGQCAGNRIAQCAIAGNGSHGIRLEPEPGGGCTGNILSDCAIQGNVGYGIHFVSGSGRCNGNLIARCVIDGNANYGIYLSGVSGQCNGNAVYDCTITRNRDYGLALDGSAGQCEGNAVVGCTVGENTDDEIILNVVTGNRLENNHVYDFDSALPEYGIYANFSTNNWIVRNTSMGHSLFMNAKDTYGPVVAVAGELATNGAAAHPWANFER